MLKNVVNFVLNHLGRGEFDLCGKPQVLLDSQLGESNMLLVADTELSSQSELAQVLSDGHVLDLSVASRRVDLTCQQLQQD